MVGTRLVVLAHARGDPLGGPPREYRVDEVVGERVDVGVDKALALPAVAVVRQRAIVIERLARRSACALGIAFEHHALLGGRAAHRRL